MVIAVLSKIIAPFGALSVCLFACSVEPAGCELFANRSNGATITTKRLQQLAPLLARRQTEAGPGKLIAFARSRLINQTGHTQLNQAPRFTWLASTMSLTRH